MTRWWVPPSPDCSYPKVAAHRRVGPPVKDDHVARVVRSRVDQQVTRAQVALLDRGGPCHQATSVQSRTTKPQRPGDVAGTVAAVPGEPRDRVVAGQVRN